MKIKWVRVTLFTYSLQMNFVCMGTFSLEIFFPFADFSVWRIVREARTTRTKQPIACLQHRQGSLRQWQIERWRRAVAPWFTSDERGAWRTLAAVSFSCFDNSPDEVWRAKRPTLPCPPDFSFVESTWDEEPKPTRQIDSLTPENKWNDPAAFCKIQY